MDPPVSRGLEAYAYRWRYLGLLLPGSEGHNCITEVPIYTSGIHVERMPACSSAAVAWSRFQKRRYLLGKLAYSAPEIRHLDSCPCGR